MTAEGLLRVTRKEIQAECWSYGIARRWLGEEGLIDEGASKCEANCFDALQKIRGFDFPLHTCKRLCRDCTVQRQTRQVFLRGHPHYLEPLHCFDWQWKSLLWAIFGFPWLLHPEYQQLSTEFCEIQKIENLWFFLSDQSCTTGLDIAMLEKQVRILSHSCRYSMEDPPELKIILDWWILCNWSQTFATLKLLIRYWRTSRCNNTVHLEKLEDMTCTHEYAVSGSNGILVVTALWDPVESWDTFIHKTLQAAKECNGVNPTLMGGFASEEKLQNIEISRAARFDRNLVPSR